MKVSIIIPNYNGMKWLANCLESVTSQTFSDYEVILIDNGSDDDSISYTQMNYPEVQILQRHENGGFAVACNQGVRQAKGNFVLLLNTDTILQTRCLKTLVECLEHSQSDVVAIQPRMLQMSEPTKIDDAGNTLSWYGEALKRGHGKPRELYDQDGEIFSPSGGASLFRKSFLDEMKGFDESFFAYLEDIDLGLRGKLAGYRYLFCSQAKVLHHGHGSAMPRGQYVTLVTCNRLLIWVKNIPFTLCWRFLGPYLYGQLYFLIAYRQPWASLKGYFRFLLRLPAALRWRVNHLRRQKISNADLSALLLSDKPAPSLSQLLRDYLKGLGRIWQRMVRP